MIPVRCIAPEPLWIFVSISRPDSQSIGFVMDCEDLFPRAGSPKSPDKAVSRNRRARNRPAHDRELFRLWDAGQHVRFPFEVESPLLYTVCVVTKIIGIRFVAVFFRPYRLNIRRLLGSSGRAGSDGGTGEATSRRRCFCHQRWL
jgi:hypothetical protein